jgi:transcriptional regulator with XRE-family HTH domain
MAPDLVGERVRRVREAKGLSLRAFAELVQSDHSTISKIENGKRDLPRDIAAQMAIQPGVDLTYILLGRTNFLPTDAADPLYRLRFPE